MDTEAISYDASGTDLKRTAIDLRGQIGSFYDACRDRVLEQSIANCTELPVQTNVTVQGEIKYGYDEHRQNILRFFFQDEHLRLSIVLGLTSNTGRASLINYSHQYNEYTRFFYYSCVNSVHKMAETTGSNERPMNSSMSSSTATHTITHIESGIDLVAVMQLRSNKDTGTVTDRILNKLLEYLLYDVNISLSSEDKEILSNNILHTTVYTNVDELKNLTSILDVSHHIQRSKTSIRPITYTLRPIKCAKFALLPRELSENIEDYVLQRITDMRQLEKFDTNNESNLLSEHLKMQLTNIETQRSNLKNILRNEFEQISNLVIAIRCGQADCSRLQEILDGDARKTMEVSINHVKQNLMQFEQKENLIQYLKQKNIDYLDASANKINEHDDEITIRKKLAEGNQNYRIFCSSDLLNHNNSNEFQKLISGLIEETNTNPRLCLIYADFSYCSFQLSNMAVLLPSVKMNEDKIEHTSSPSIETVFASSNIPENSIEDPVVGEVSNTYPVAPSAPSGETIKILLLGETGVGKSTFINAFANYHKYNTLAIAESSEPVVLMPVSFVITTGNDFAEHIVQFGDINDSHDEDFHHAGQSVTQHCKSYTFDINHSDGKKLCIIDTPGFYDTRGVEQDDYNMQHILDYIKDVNCVDFICVLFKPNDTRLSIFYRSCFTQLLSVLHRNSVNNIIFCFTNSRSTFYSPGDTAPLIKKMLTQVSLVNIPFKKDNVFCFDSESFRYLVALHNRIPFDHLDKEEYEKSWIHSVSQANRLIQYICDNFDDSRRRNQ
ncbi:unnamed protein product [Rotaria magnacalcarata]|uniref:G domain-containing protein n=4 Tax=Rotaria magnacalcarata TaxID=392030 RepID=A0A816MLG7_9BILA|nr:unnamed protein product [Rotaria magnacalcarata]